MIDVILSQLGWIILAIVILFIFSMGMKIVRPLEKGVVERLGKFRKVADQGFHWIIPVVDRMYRVNLTEQMMDVDPQEVITEDNLNARVNLVVYYKVKRDDESVKKSIYNVDDFEQQIISLAQTTARNVIGTMNFKTVNSERSSLNTSLAQVLVKESDAWGVEIVRVEMIEITPPKDVQDTMNKVLKAENEKVAAVDFATAKETEADGHRRAQIKIADGEKQSEILRAEGEKKSAILVSEGKKASTILEAEAAKTAAILQAEAKKEAAIREAEGEAEAIIKVQTAIADGIRKVNEAQPSEAVLRIKSLEAFEKAADGKATKIIIPSEIQGMAGLATSLIETVKK